MTIKQEKISRERRKYLRHQLNELMKESRHFLYLSAGLQWLQFLMRILSFAYFSYLFSQLYIGNSINLYMSVFFLLAINGIGFSIALLAQKYQGLPSQCARNHLKARFFQHFLNMKGEFGKQETTADILTVASQGIDSLDTYYSVYWPTLLRTFVNCVTIIIIVTILFPVGGLIFLFSLPFIPISIMLIQKKSKKIMEKYWSSYMNVGNQFMDYLKGLNTLYHYQADELYESHFEKNAEAFRLSTMELLAFQLQSVGYMDSVMYVGIGLSGFVAVKLLMMGQLTLMSMLFFVFIAAEFFAPIRELGYCMHLLMMNTKMADRMFTFLDGSSSIHSNMEEQEGVFQPIQSISIEKISFGFDTHQVFKNLTLHFEKGNLYAIAGESGAGKTTLTQLILGRLSIHSGQMFFNQRSSTQWSRKALDREMMYISPNSYLFDGSIMENLMMGTKKSSEEIICWLQEKHMLSFVDSLPNGMDTRVGENGSFLSPGQRQQIICARAFLADRSLYLLDEMTSSVDSEHESIILSMLSQMAKEKLVIFITHKMKQVEKAATVCFIEKNGVVYMDKPTVLYDTCKNYRQLVDTQRDLEEILHESAYIN